VPRPASTVCHLPEQLSSGMLVISDLHIFRAAQLIVKRHGASRASGADAPIVAAQRADELFNEGDLDGVVV
jgi:hypothetical protein